MIGKLELCESYNANAAEAGTSKGELKVAKEGELFARLKLAGCLSEDHPAGRLLIQQAESAILDPDIGVSIDGLSILDGRKANTERKAYECRISTKGRENLYLALSAQCVSDLGVQRGQKLRAGVSFRLNRLPFAEMRYALRKLENLDLVFPEEKKAFRKRLGL